MELHGTVQNGVVVFDTPVSLADGTRVKIRIASPAEAPRNLTLGERLMKLAGTVEGLPADMAEEHDHYIHGTPKRGKQPAGEKHDVDESEQGNP